MMTTLIIKNICLRKIKRQEIAEDMYTQSMIC